MEIIELPKKHFSVLTLQDKYNNGQLKNNLDAYNYIFEYYFESSCGMYYFYDYIKNEFILKTDNDFNKEVLKKINNKKFCDLVKANPIIFNIVCKIGKPRIYKENDIYYINEGGAFKHQTYKSYDDYDEKIKNNVQMIFDMIKQVSCNNDDEMFKAYITYYAQIARGMKTQIIPYRKCSIQGFGKSKETDFIFKHVFGSKVCLLCSNAEPLLTSFNKIFMGKILVIFEELPTFTDTQWSAVSSKLKTLCTEEYTTYRDVFEKGIQAENISNFMINTNVESIKDSDGRRYIILDLNTERKDDYEYFEKIIENCYNDEVGEAFFSYLKTKITDEECKKFYGQRDFPETSNKRIAIANKLNSVYKFIKFDYVLKSAGISKITRSELYNLYKLYCESNDIKKAIGRNDFYKKLSEIGINVQPKNNGEYYYVETKERLKEISDKNKWVCEFDDYEEPNKTYMHGKNKKSDLDHGLPDYKKLYEDALKRISELESPKSQLDKDLEELERLEILEQKSFKK